MALRETNLVRSISSKEPSFSKLVTFVPPRLSLNTSTTTTTTLPFSPSHQTFSIPSHRCIASVLKKDGQITTIASSNGLVYTGSESNVIRIWKLPEYTECGTLKTKACMVVALHVTNDRVYAAYADCKIRVWCRHWNGTVEHVRLANIPSTGSFVWSYIGGKDKLMKKHMGLISSLAINMVDDILYSSSLDKTIKVWRISDFKCMETIQAHTEPINAIIVGDDSVLYTASDDATIRVWRRNFCSDNSRPHSLIVTLPAKNSPIKTLTMASDGGVLYGGCSDGYIHYWLKGWFSGQLQYGGSLQGHTHAIMCLANVSSYLITGSADSTCRVWVKESDGQHSCLAVMQGHRGPIRCVAGFRSIWSVDDQETGDEGCTVCTGSLDGVLKVWRVTRSRKFEQLFTQNASQC